MCAGMILALIIGPAIAYAGVSSHWEGWWIFGHTVTDLTPVYWVGFGISIAGLALLATGGFGALIACLLEILDKHAQTSQPSEQHK
jgi:MFS family permease